MSVKRSLKIFSIVIISIITVIIIFVISLVLYSKYVVFPNWVIEHLESKYNETMVINEITFGEMGYNAYVSTEEIPDLNFLVRGKYDDMYLERVLEYEAEKQIESMFPRSKCTAIMTLRSNKSTVYDDLYKLYEKLGRPAQWSDVPQYMKFAELYISVDDADETKICDVVNAVEGCIFKSFRLCIENNDQEYDFVLNDEQHYMKDET